ncbi:ferritin-like domain-containing protein [Telmatobacter sp. DSM 110680]|uniref:Ferritin-like domain-containing protein n=1 Tax=Telmatobacter sp. DSM 110680 TaxID=3036704 RepID=A0AAU7DKR5_9BACT
MPLTKRELWLLNLYRNSELQGALLMGRLARSVTNPDVLVGATRHCATEASHAALLTEVIAKLGGTIDPSIETIQMHYSQDGGIPKAMVDLLVLSEILEARVLMSYREHLQRSDVHPNVRRTLQRIIQDEEAHSGENGWVEQLIAGMPPEQVAATLAKWRDIDEKVAEQLHSRLASDFPEEGTHLEC